MPPAPELKPFAEAPPAPRSVLLSFKSSFPLLLSVDIMKEVNFVAKLPPELEKYRGMHVAIIGDKVVASGKSAYLVWKTAKKKNPDKRPVLAFVPKKETLILLL